MGPGKRRNPTIKLPSVKLERVNGEFSRVGVLSCQIGRCDRGWYGTRRWHGAVPLCYRCRDHVCGGREALHTSPGDGTN